jgi:hypothetical protein
VAGFLGIELQQNRNVRNLSLISPRACRIEARVIRA